MHYVKTIGFHFRYFYKNIIFSFIRRIFDILISLCLLIIFSPIMGIIAIILYRKEGNPVLYRERRVGKNSHVFMMYSFRTTSNPTTVIRAFPPHPFPNSWKKGVPPSFRYFRNDKRIFTEFGVSIYKYKLHKLPRLWNVLKGDMSFIGPEAEIPDIVDYYNRYQMNRLNIKPGLTGYAQIHGFNNLTHGKKVEYDLYYVNNRSYLLDLKILWQLILAFFKAMAADKESSTIK